MGESVSDPVDVPFGDKPSDQAVLLLAAAEDLGLDAAVVQTYEGGFRVPKEVHDQAYHPKKKPAKKSESKEG
jgi:hypothetical protein